MKQNRFFHILIFPHFIDKRNDLDKTDKNYDRFWKMKTIFDKLSTKETQMAWDKNLQVMLF
jgi:hypothetical protein